MRKIVNYEFDIFCKEYFGVLDPVQCLNMMPAEAILGYLEIAFNRGVTVGIENYRGWVENPDRMGGQFTDEEINRPDRL